MTRWRLVLAGLRHHRRTHLGLAAGFAVAAAVLSGALCVGDSVRATLRAAALARIGRIDAVLASGDRNFRSVLADELAAKVPEVGFAPLLQLSAVASTAGGARRATGVSVLGVDARFFALAPEPGSISPPARGELLVNERLARQLGVGAGDEVLLRVDRPSALSRDMVLANPEDASLALRGKVAGLVDDASFGRFALSAEPLPPHAAYLALDWLQEELELGARANLLLAGGGDAPATTERANAALREAWTLEDAELSIERRDDPPQAELLSPRIFLDEPVARALAELDLPVLGILTYFVNGLRRPASDASEARSTPYSTVAALGMLGRDEPPAPGLRAVAPADLAQDELVVGRWLADDLAIGAGAELELSYFVPGPDRRLVEATRRLRVRSVVALEGLAADRSLMPDFPGISDSEHCRDWEPGVPIELDAIRDVDEQYWEAWRGTPKAFVSLAAGRSMWASRFGSLTAARVPIELERELATRLRARLDPAELGLFFRDLRTQALAAGRSATDFGGLFLGLSSFLIAAALLLAGMLLRFGVEQRARELGTFFALGYAKRDVRRLFLAEAALVALVGALAGTIAGLGYTRLVLRGLATIWRGAVASTPIEFHASALSLAIGAGGTLLAGLVAAHFALRSSLRRPPVELLASSQGVAAPAAEPARARFALALALACCVAAAAIGFAARGGDGASAAGAFFGAGSLLLVGALALARVAIRRAAGGALPRSVASLGLRNAGRRPGRSLAVAALLASGAFLVLSIGAHRKSVDGAGADRRSGTGGFALYGESTLPVHEELDTERGRDAYGLDASELEGVEVVALRVRAGDDASCLNLASPQTPRLFGVDPRELARRGAFAFAAIEDERADASPWLVLDEERADGAVPAIGDQASVQWTLHQRLGGTLEYVDERGRPFEVRIVATLADSMLQGSLLIGERAFQDRFPSDEGYRAFLVDAAPERAEEVAAALSRALSDQGLALTPAALRLAEFHAVQNTYLDVFQVLGGLGLALGSLGLGVVVLRNALERRRELALLRAVGFRSSSLRRMLFAEHALLVALGLGAGALSAAVALLPAVRSASAASPLSSALPILAALAAGGFLCVALATAAAARGPLLDALRSE